MTPQRISLKCFVAPDPRAPIELQPVIGLFHRFIQHGSLEGLLIDVADYAHVPEGPGVVLIGHDVDYGIDLAGGRAGLLTTRKRIADVPLDVAVHDTLRRALRAVRAIEADAGVGLCFDCGRFDLSLLDRLAAPNQDAAYAVACKEIEPISTRLYGAGGFTLSRLDADEPRRSLGLSITARSAPDAAALLERLSSSGPAGRMDKGDLAMDAQSPWDISVEDLQQLRASGAAFRLIDVREAHEYEICNLEGELIPLGQLSGRLGEIDASAHVVVYCRSGNRSARAVQLMRASGFENAWNLNGGILAWIDRIDASLTRY